MYPPAMLDNVYVRGSLRNTAQGFELTLRNNVDYATIVGLGFVVVDGTTYPPAAVTLQVGNREIKGDAITYRTSVPISVGSEARVIVEGQSLAPGAHRVSLSITEWQVGRLQFEIADEVK